jgi:hypothetical protein
MRLYIFKSESKPGLGAFAGDGAGAQLPKNFAPWRVVGLVSAKRAPPHGLPRAKIEAGIQSAGYQLWRVKKPAAAPAVEETA